LAKQNLEKHNKFWETLPPKWPRGYWSGIATGHQCPSPLACAKSCKVCLDIDHLIICFKLLTVQYIKLLSRQGISWPRFHGIAMCFNAI